MDATTEGCPAAACSSLDSVCRQNFVVLVRLLNKFSVPSNHFRVGIQRKQDTKKYDIYIFLQNGSENECLEYFTNKIQLHITSLS